MRYTFLLLTLPAFTLQEGKASVDVLFAPTGEKRLLEERISAEIRAAKKEVLIAIYQFTSKQIAEAVVASHGRGLDVRILVDAVQSEQGGPYGEVMKLLAAAKVPIRRVWPEGVGKKPRQPEGQRPKFHNKFCAIDGQKALTGSYNWTVLADTENHENLVIITGKDVGARFAARFEEVWNDEKITER